MAKLSRNIVTAIAVVALFTAAAATMAAATVDEESSLEQRKEWLSQVSSWKVLAAEAQKYPFGVGLKRAPLWPSELLRLADAGLLGLKLEKTDEVATVFIETTDGMWVVMDPALVSQAGFVDKAGNRIAHYVPWHDEDVEGLRFTYGTKGYIQFRREVAESIINDKAAFQNERMVCLSGDQLVSIEVPMSNAVALKRQARAIERVAELQAILRELWVQRPSDSRWEEAKKKFDAFGIDIDKVNAMFD